MENTSNFNELTLKALMLDTITHLKTGSHINPAYIQAKRSLCKLSGQPVGINSRKLLTLIGKVYEDNGKVDKFWACIDKMKAEEYVIQA